MVNLKVISISISMLVILLLSTTSYAQTIDDYYTIDFGFQYRDIGVKDFLNPVGPECGLSYHFRRDHLDIVPHMKLFTSFAEYKISDSKEIGGSGIGFDLGFCIDWYFYNKYFLIFNFESSFYYAEGHTKELQTKTTIWRLFETGFDLGIGGKITDEFYWFAKIGRGGVRDAIEEKWFWEFYPAIGIMIRFDYDY